MPPPVRQRVPSIEERTQVAVGLGLIGPGEELSPRLQRQTAQLIGLAEANEEAEDRAAAADPVPQIISTYTRLTDAGLPDFAAAQIVAALAPGFTVQTIEGAAHAHG